MGALTVRAAEERVSVLNWPVESVRRLATVTEPVEKAEPLSAPVMVPPALPPTSVTLPVALMALASV